MGIRQGVAWIGVLTMVGVVGCGKDEPSGPPGGVWGKWSVHASIDATHRGEGVYSENFTVSISQNGNALSVDIGGTSFTGTLNGTQATWSGSYDEDDGTTTETYTVTFANSNTTMTGSSTWTWSDGVQSCSGTSTFSGDK